MAEALKQSFNKVEITGILSEMEHRFGVKDGKDYIGGKLLIEVSEDNVIPVDFFSYKITKAGTPSKIYNSLESIVNTYKSIQHHTRAGADMVSVTGGSIGENVFYPDENANPIRSFKISSSFYNRVQGVEPVNKFTLVGTVLKVLDEIIKDVPTGNVIVELLTVGFNEKPDVIQITVPAEGAAWAKAQGLEGNDVKIAGQVIFKQETSIRTEAAGFGDDFSDERNKTVKQLVAKSISLPTTSALTNDDIKRLCDVRSQSLNAKKADSGKTNAAASSGKSAPANFVL